MSSRGTYYNRPRGRGGIKPRGRGYIPRDRSRGKQFNKSYHRDDRYYKYSKEKYESLSRRHDRRQLFLHSRSRSRSHSHDRPSYSHYSHGRSRSRSRSYSRSPPYHQSQSPSSSYHQSHSPFLQHNHSPSPSQKSEERELVGRLKPFSTSSTSRLQTPPKQSRKYQELTVKPIRSSEDEKSGVMGALCCSYESSEVIDNQKGSERYEEKIESMKKKPLKMGDDSNTGEKEQKMKENRYNLQYGEEKDLRSQLLERALMEKQKLGLDNFARTDTSSALEALQCYSPDLSPHTEKDEEDSNIKKIERETIKNLCYLKKEKTYQERDLVGNKVKSPVSQPVNSSKPLKSILKIRRADEQSDSFGKETITNNSASKKRDSIYLPQIPGLDFDSIDDEEEFLYGDSENISKVSEKPFMRGSPPGIGEKLNHNTGNKESSGWSDEEDNFERSDQRDVCTRSRTPSPIPRSKKCKNIISTKKLKTECEDTKKSESQKLSYKGKSEPTDDDLTIDLQLPKDKGSFLRNKSPNQERSISQEFKENQMYGKWESPPRENVKGHHSASRYSRSLEDFHSPLSNSSIHKHKLETDNIGKSKCPKLELKMNPHYSSSYEDISKEKLRALKEELAHFRSLDSELGNYEQLDYHRKQGKHSPEESKKIIKVPKKLSPSLDCGVQKRSYKRRENSPDHYVQRKTSIERREHSPSFDTCSKMSRESRERSSDGDISRKTPVERKLFKPGYHVSRKASHERRDHSPEYNTSRKMSLERRYISPVHDVGRKTSFQKQTLSPGYDVSYFSPEEGEFRPGYDTVRKTSLERRDLSPYYDAGRKALIKRKEYCPGYDDERQMYFERREFSPDYDYIEYNQKSRCDVQGKRMVEKERYLLESLQRSPHSLRQQFDEENLRKDSLEVSRRSLEIMEKSSRKYSLERRSSPSPRRDFLERRHRSQGFYEGSSLENYSVERSPVRDSFERKKKSPRRSPERSHQREHRSYSPCYSPQSPRRSPQYETYDSRRPLEMNVHNISTKAHELYEINQTVQNSSFFNTGLSHSELSVVFHGNPDSSLPTPIASYPPPTFPESYGPPPGSNVPNEQLFPPSFTSFPPPGYQYPPYSIPPAVPTFSQHVTMPSLSVPPPSLPSKYLQSSHKRVTTRSNLRIIPLESNVQTTSVFNAPKVLQEPEQKFVDLTEEELKMLVEKKKEQQTQLNVLIAEVERLRKMQGEMMRKKQRQKDGHKDPLLLENSKLQDEINKQITDLKKIVEETEKQIELGKRHLNAEETLVQGVGPNKQEPNEEKTEDTVRFKYFDPGSHWCKLCNEVYATLPQLFDHLHNSTHKQKMDALDRPWAPENKKKHPVEKNIAPKILIPLKGVQFIYPISGFYCSLCKEFMGDGACADGHLKSQKHNRSYMKYTLLNPFYERRWNLDKTTAVAQHEKKRHIEEEKQQLAKRMKQEKEAEKRTKAVIEIEKRTKAEKEKSKEINELEEDFVTPPSKNPHTPTEEIQEKSKSKGIKLTLLGDKSKNDVQRKNDAESKKEIKPKMVIIGKAPNYRSMLAASKTEDTKASVFGKLNLKKNEQEENKEEAKQDSPEIFQVNKTNATSKITDISGVNKSLALCEEDTAKAFTGETQTKETNKTFQDFSQGSTSLSPSGEKCKKCRKRKKQCNHDFKTLHTFGPHLPETFAAGPVTEEEHDLSMLGIDKADMIPLAKPKPPPSVLRSISCIKMAIEAQQTQKVVDQKMATESSECEIQDQEEMTDELLKQEEKSVSAVASMKNIVEPHMPSEFDLNTHKELPSPANVNTDQLNASKKHLSLPYAGGKCKRCRRKRRKQCTHFSKPLGTFGPGLPFTLTAGPITEEEHDLNMLGIDKADMIPLTKPKPPPSVTKKMLEDKGMTEAQCKDIIQEESITTFVGSDYKTVRAIKHEEKATCFLPTVEKMSESYTGDQVASNTDNELPKKIEGTTGQIFTKVQFGSKETKTSSGDTTFSVDKPFLNDNIKKVKILSKISEHCFKEKEHLGVKTSTFTEVEDTEKKLANSITDNTSHENGLMCEKENINILNPKPSGTGIQDHKVQCDFVTTFTEGKTIADIVEMHVTSNCDDEKSSSIRENFSEELCDKNLFSTNMKEESGNSQKPEKKKEKKMHFTDVRHKDLHSDFASSEKQGGKRKSNPPVFVEKEEGGSSKEEITCENSKNVVDNDEWMGSEDDVEETFIWEVTEDVEYNDEWEITEDVDSNGEDHDEWEITEVVEGDSEDDVEDGNREMNTKDMKVSEGNDEEKILEESENNEVGRVINDALTVVGEVIDDSEENVEWEVTEEVEDNGEWEVTEEVEDNSELEISNEDSDGNEKKNIEDEYNRAGTNNTERDHTENYKEMNIKQKRVVPEDHRNKIEINITQAYDDNEEEVECSKEITKVVQRKSPEHLKTCIGREHSKDAESNDNGETKSVFTNKEMEFYKRAEDNNKVKEEISDIESTISKDIGDCKNKAAEDPSNVANKINKDSAVSKEKTAEGASSTVDKINKDATDSKDKFADGTNNAVDKISEDSAASKDKAAGGPCNTVDKVREDSAASKDKAAGGPCNTVDKVREDSAASKDKAAGGPCNTVDKNSKDRAVAKNTIGDKDITKNTVVTKSKVVKDAGDDDGRVSESTCNSEGKITEDTNDTRGKIYKDIEDKKNNEGEELISGDMHNVENVVIEDIDTKFTKNLEKKAEESSENDNKTRISIGNSQNKVEKDSVRCLESADKSSEGIKSKEYIVNNDTLGSTGDYTRKSYEKEIINKEHTESTNTKIENISTENYTSLQTPECMKEEKGYQNYFQKDVGQEAQGSKNIESVGILSLDEVGPSSPENTETGVDEEAIWEVSGDADGLMELIEGVASDLLESDEKV
ncbi:uncharacterized protein LOC106463948 [Limulus polyphemus]|uniref:Uncharacterized protein LOC106463948 n=1 Tax=Limulus polyphemus TaxID=6850 RepID=A0ABM1BCZ3_LIMPO|nr:uncharacterized protein LOC106463948 [Limulus polyphemus]